MAAVAAAAGCHGASKYPDLHYYNYEEDSEQKRKAKKKPVKQKQPAVRSRDYQPANTDLPPPPRYEDSYPSEPPPSYQSLYGRVRTMQVESRNPVHFGTSVYKMLKRTVGCAICIAVSLAIPIAMFAMGIKYIHSCPAEKYIPIYLTVGGLFGILLNLSFIAQNFAEKRKKSKKKRNGQSMAESMTTENTCNSVVAGPNTSTTYIQSPETSVVAAPTPQATNAVVKEEDEGSWVDFCDGCLMLFLLAWFIAGNVWIYRTRDRFNDDETSDNFCHPTIYWFGFWLITGLYIMIASVFVLVCCCACVSICMEKDKPENETITERPGTENEIMTEKPGKCTNAQASAPPAEMCVY